jgi:tetratricopeptide (TPR) repeat protein
MARKKATPEADSWVEQAFPEMHYLVLALDGQEESLEWLKNNSPGIGLLARSLAGKRKALAALHAGEPDTLKDLFEIFENEDLAAWLAKRRPELQRLFEAVQGKAEAVANLKRENPALARLALVVRDLYESHIKAPPEENGLEKAAGDMGCLVGEMHLRQGEFEKAIDAFNRALEDGPAADLFEGRARAYEGLAEEDRRRAGNLRRSR